MTEGENIFYYVLSELSLVAAAAAMAGAATAAVNLCEISPLFTS